MATNFLLELDTTAPAGVTVSIDSGATYTTDVDVSVAIASSSPDAAMVKIYGDVDNAFDADIQTTEGASSWKTLSSPHAVRVSTGDGVKTVRVKVRDDVLNVSSEATDTITLDTSAPIPDVTSGPTPSKISKISTKDTASFNWSPDVAITAYKVKVVSSSGAAHSTGTQIPTTAGSTNMSGGAVAGAGSVTSTINGTDLETASGGDGNKIVKVFVQDAAGNWSV